MDGKRKLRMSTSRNSCSAPLFSRWSLAGTGMTRAGPRLVARFCPVLPVVSRENENARRPTRLLYFSAPCPIQLTPRRILFSSPSLIETVVSGRGSCRLPRAPLARRGVPLIIHDNQLPFLPKCPTSPATVPAHDDPNGCATSLPLLG